MAQQNQTNNAFASNEETLLEKNRTMQERQDAIAAADARRNESRDKRGSSPEITYDLFTAIQALTAELNEIKYRLDTMDQKETSTPAQRRRISLNESQGPVRRPPVGPAQITLRDALDLVPKYDGKNLTVFQFSRYCKRARDMLPPEIEYEFTVAVTSKLQGHAYLAIEDKEFYTVDELIEHLKAVFSPPKTANQYRGELGNIYMQPNENILDYVSRIKDLKVAILDEEKRMLGRAADNFIVSQLEKDVVSAFCNGLPPDLLIRLKIEGYVSFEDAVTKAIRLNKQLEIEAARYRDSRPSCTLCKKKGHSAANCYGNQTTNNNNNNSNAVNKGVPKGATVNVPSAAPSNMSNDLTSICKYCKNPGHSMNDCIKLQNRRRALAAQQQAGNGQGARLTDANRSNLPQSRPVNVVEFEEETGIPEDLPEEVTEELTEDLDRSSL